MRSVLWAVLWCATTSTTLAGQTIAGGIGATHFRLSRESGGSGELLTGTAFGIVAGVTKGRVSLALDYLQGPIGSADGSVEEDAVEGEAIVLVRPARWVAIGTGAHARSFVSEAGTQRWVFWEGRIRTEASLFGPVRGYLAGWRVLAASVNLVDPFDHGYGVDGGVAVSFGSLPVTVRVRYRADRISLAGGSRTLTTERLGLAATIGRF